MSWRTRLQGVQQIKTSQPCQCRFQPCTPSLGVVTVVRGTFSRISNKPLHFQGSSIIISSTSSLAINVCHQNFLGTTPLQDMNATTACDPLLPANLLFTLLQSLARSLEKCTLWRTYCIGSLYDITLIHWRNARGLSPMTWSAICCVEDAWNAPPLLLGLVNAVPSLAFNSWQTLLDCCCLYPNFPASCWSGLHINAGEQARKIDVLHRAYLLHQQTSPPECFWTRHNLLALPLRLTPCRDQAWSYQSISWTPAGDLTQNDRSYGIV